jgi:hypothetical protein
MSAFRVCGYDENWTGSRHWNYVAFCIIVSHCLFYMTLELCGVLYYHITLFVLYATGTMWRFVLSYHIVCFIWQWNYVAFCIIISHCLFYMFWKGARRSFILRHTGWSKSLCAPDDYSIEQLRSWKWPSQNTFGMWTVLYWTRSSRTKFGVSNVWRLAGDTLNITFNFVYCNHQVHRDFLITLYDFLAGKYRFSVSVYLICIITMVLPLSVFVFVGLHFPVQFLFVLDCAGVFYVVYYVYLSQ